MKEMLKRGRLILMILSLTIIMLLVISGVSAGIIDWFKKTITGKLSSQPVTLNITVGVPQIVTVYNSTVILGNGPAEAPVTSTIVVNFTVYSAIGAGNLNHSSARANFTKSGDDTRQNLSCFNSGTGGNYANYTCNITVWWWDGTGTWTIGTYIEDNNTNSHTNSSLTSYVGERTAFIQGPSALTWQGISAGVTNRTSNNDPLLLNNTGNDDIASGNVQVNATNLRGETDNTKALWAGNFSVGTATGGACSGAACVECGGTQMVLVALTGVTGSVLEAGNYTINNGTAGQEQLYFCLRLAGAELTTQAYSTSNETAWTIKII